MSTRPHPHYPKTLGLLRNRRIRTDIAALDATADCERIVALLAKYEFGFDIARSLELALFHTYGSQSVSRLLDATQQFAQRGQQRYDDTRLLISHFIEDGFDSPVGKQAIARMNSIHGRFRIPNDDYVFVLSTFITYPIDWLAKYGYRPMTEHEQLAWFNFFAEVGRRMGMTDIPADQASFRAWAAAYEARELVYAPENQRVANATVAIFEGWFPPGTRWAVKPVVRALIRDDLRAAFGYAPAPGWLRALLSTVLGTRAALKRWFHLERTPRTIANTRNRTYPGNRYYIDSIGPKPIKRSQPPTNPAP